MNIYKNLYLKTLLTFLIVLAYAIVRYNVFGNVSWSDVPLFITNKAISLTVVLLLLFSTIKKGSVEQQSRQKFWDTIFILVILHVVISLILLGPEYYSKFYFENELNLIGYLTLFFGISAFIGIIILNSTKIVSDLKVSDSINKKIRYIIPFLIASHLFTMGFKGWVSPSNWYGYLIPISLISFLTIVIYIIRVVRK